jgi:hypothetical protein
MSDLYVKPSTQFDTVLVGAPTGLAGTVGVQVLDGDTDTVVTARTTAGIIESPSGSGSYVTTLTSPADAGGYRIVWDSGVISPSTVAVDRLQVTATGMPDAGNSGPYLMTLDEFKARIGTPLTDTRKDVLYSLSLAAASAVILSYTDRDFGVAETTETREFEYDGSGYMDIDDAVDITAVAFTVPGGQDITLDPLQWSGQPHRSRRTPVYTQLILPTFGQHYFGSSPAMGFTRNLDLLAREGRLPGSIPSTVKVTGTFGWPEVPEDVKLAVVWTVQDWLAAPKAANLTAESIEGFSRAWGRIGGQESRAIPSRALDILAQYERISI